MIAANIDKIRQQCGEKVKLIVVSKTRPVGDMMEAWDAGQRAFGENRVQEMLDKKTQMPAETEWHMIGHLQTNKVKQVVPFVHLIHGVDSLKLLEVVNAEAQKAGRVVNCLLQLHIAAEETKFGLNEPELGELLDHLHDYPEKFKNVEITGLMGMASNTRDTSQVRKEFRYLRNLFERSCRSNAGPVKMQELSMGMSGDYQIAIEEGSTLVRIGSLIFGER
jgi:pyridoxal phosphate enzyme (YggS family)